MPLTTTDVKRLTRECARPNRHGTAHDIRIARDGTTFPDTTPQGRPHKGGERTNESPWRQLRSVMDRGKRLLEAHVYPRADKHEAYAPLFDAHTFGGDTTDAPHMTQVLTKTIVPSMIEDDKEGLQDETKGRRPDQD